MQIRSLMLIIKEAPTDHDTHICYLNPMLIWTLICHFWYNIMKLYQPKGLIIIYAPVTSMTWYSPKEEDTSVDHTHTYKIKKRIFEISKS